MKGDSDLYAEIGRILARGERAVLATVVRTRGSTPRKAGAKLLVRQDGSCVGTICGGCVEAEVYARAVELFNHAKPELLSYSLNDDAAAEYGLRCGGVMEVYLERLLPRFELWLFGAGHINRAVHAIVRSLDFSVHVVDDHPGFASSEHFPGAEIHCVPFEEGAALVRDGKHIAALIATRGHLQDATVFDVLVRRELGYLGLVASWKRLLEFYRPLLQSGFPLEKLRSIHAPVGLDIGSESPEEIAVAAVAELLAAFKGGEKGSLATQFWNSAAAAKLTSTNSD
jgi:xanthine dehydrogenase accessory factor